jgi:archaellum component FlaC
MDETNKVEALEREVNALKESMEQAKSDTTAALSKMSDMLAAKDQEINSMRASIEELKRNYEIEEESNEEANDEPSD